MPENFSNVKELFLRAVRPPETFPHFWKNGKLSSAAFKDSKGLSVDRTGDRTVEDAAKSMLKKFEGHIYGVSVENCLENEVCMRHLPSSTNPYHCELHGSSDKIVLSQSQARALAQCATYVMK